MRVPIVFEEESVPLFHAPEEMLEMAPVAGAGWTLVPCNLSKQDRTEFCWAAVTQAIERNHGIQETQCVIARSILGGLCGADCAGCNQPEPLADVLQIRKRLRKPIRKQVTFKEISDEIGGKRVICCGIERPPSGHFIIICGVLDVPGKQEIAILDPSKSVASGPQAHDFAAFIGAYDAGGVWKETYFTK